MINPMDLTGKHIIVTGASSGIGKQTCITLSQLGAKISLVARNEERLKETISMMDGSDHLVFPFDVSQIDEIEELVKSVVTQNGKVNGLVHAAGIGTVKPLSMTKYDFFLDMMKTNFFAFVEFVRILGKKKFTDEAASIVALSSAGTIKVDKGKEAYVATKGALDNVAKQMALELGESRKIRVNTIKPGWVKTDMYYGFINEFGQERMDEILQTSFLGAAEPVDVANLLAFLLSDASRMITGQNIVIDGGWSIH